MTAELVDLVTFTPLYYIFGWRTLSKSKTALTNYFMGKDWFVGVCKMTMLPV